MSRVYFTYYLLFHILYLVKAQQQQPFFYPAPSPLTQSLSLKHFYHLDTQSNSSLLYRYEKRPRRAASLAHRPLDGAADDKSTANYMIQSSIERYSKPSQSSIDYLIHSTATRTRWQTVPQAQTTMESVLGLVPNVTDHATILTLAKMSYDAYTGIGGDDWYDLDKKQWATNDTFGWTEDGMRGHVFSNEDDSLIVIAIKGTTGGLFTPGPTGDKDKLNDNMLFSCCCARVSRVWRPVCDCYQGQDYQCDERCVEDTILKEELYYDHALEIYKDISDQYPEATVFLTGHSLGGALAALVGHTFGAPAVSFEAPGERLASKRLHLPHAPGVHTPVYHFGHTADPIFIGLCNGVSSACWYGGYAMETRCHSGKSCIWDTVNDHGWRVDVRSHRIGDIIEKILGDPDTFPLPRCQMEQDCIDCGLWDFADHRDLSGIEAMSNCSV